MEKEAMDTENLVTNENQDHKKETTQQNPTPIIRVPVKHSNLGMRSHAMSV